MTIGKINFVQVGPNVWKSMVEMPRTPQPNLPHGIYTLGYDPETGEPTYTSVEDAFSVPKKIYGNVVSRVSKVANTFRARNSNTGVLLSGDKGGGKTMTGKAIALYLHHNDKMPILLVMGKIHPIILSKALADIPSAVIFIDEFEKSFPNGATEDGDRDDSKGDQVNLLSLMDGVLNNKHLFILTTNDLSHINEYLRGRPNRIFYNFKYSGLEHSIIEEYCNEKITDKARCEEVIATLKCLHSISFDIMQGVVEECLRYSTEPAFKLLEDMSINFITDINRVYVTWKFPKRHALYDKIHDPSSSKNYISIHDSTSTYIELVGVIHVRSQKQATELIRLVGVNYGGDDRLVSTIRQCIPDEEYRKSKNSSNSAKKDIGILLQALDSAYAEDIEITNEEAFGTMIGNYVAVGCDRDKFVKLDPKELVGKLFRLNFNIPRSNFTAFGLNRSELKVSDDCTVVFDRNKN